jgi:hypothetical protein
LIVKPVVEAVDEAAIMAEDDTADGDEAVEGVPVAPISTVLILPTQIEISPAENGMPWAQLAAQQL